MGNLEKIPAWNLTKVRSKKEVIGEARTSGAKVHFASLMDICHFKNAELETKHQKYKGRVVLRGDIVKDDSGSYAVFTEQGSSASQMTAAKVMDYRIQIARVHRTRWLNQCINQLLPERSQRFVHESWRVHRCDRLILANQPYSTIFSSVFSRQQCCQPRAARRPSRLSTQKSLLITISRRQTPVTHRTLHQVYPSTIQQFSHLWHTPARRVHWVLVQEMSTHDQLSLVRFDARSRVLSFLVLHSVNLVFVPFSQG